MKLWWPHSEAMIALLMGYSDSGDPALLHLFYQVAEYTFRQVSAASLICGLSKGEGETAGSHSSSGRPGPGFPGQWGEAGQGWGGSSHIPYSPLHLVWSLSWSENSWRSPSALCSVNEVVPDPLELMFQWWWGDRP